MSFLMWYLVTLPGALAAASSAAETCKQVPLQELYQDSQPSNVETRSGSPRSGAIMLQAKSESLEQTHRVQDTEKLQRRVYIDLGANWANTLRLYRDIDKSSKEKGPWEVYAFEASPLIQPYLQSFGAWLSGKAVRPKLLVPPAGSTVHLRRYAGHYGCSSKSDETMRECMFHVFHKPLQQMQKIPQGVPIAFIDMQLAVASSALGPADRDRYTIIPAAVGGENGTLTLSEVTAEQMIRGGAHSTGKSSKASTVKVPQVDFASWLAAHFHEDDHIVLKMDIEGAEFAILEKLEKLNSMSLVDVLALECHAVAGNCKTLLKKLKDTPNLKLLTEGQGYQGWDSFSSPQDYLPEDPGVRGPDVYQMKK